MTIIDISGTICYPENLKTQTSRGLKTGNESFRTLMRFSRKLHCTNGRGEGTSVKVVKTGALTETTGPLGDRRPDTGWGRCY